MVSHKKKKNDLRSAASLDEVPSNNLMALWSFYIETL